MTAYAFGDTVADPELARLRRLEAMFDEISTHRLAALGVGPGWRVLEVGFGAGGTARWLAGRVGTTGHVVATDIDPRFAAELDGSGAEVRRHDILTDELDPASYDLVHARCLLEHLPDPARAIDRMVAALRPGGWLVVEDIDFLPATIEVLAAYAHPPELAELFALGARGVEQVFEKVGANPHLGPRLQGMLADAGLTELSGHVFGSQSRASAEFTRYTVEVLRQPILATGTATAEDLDRIVAATEDPAVRLTPILLVTAWGRRPR